MKKYLKTDEHGAIAFSPRGLAEFERVCAKLRIAEQNMDILTLRAQLLKLNYEKKESELGESMKAAAHQVSIEKKKVTDFIEEFKNIHNIDLNAVTYDDISGKITKIVRQETLAEGE